MRSAGLSALLVLGCLTGHGLVGLTGLASLTGLVGLTGLTGCKAEAEVKTSADLDLAPSPDLEDEPAPRWEEAEPSTGPRAARALESPARWDGPPTATYPGFRVFDDGTSRVFIEIAGGDVSVEESAKNGVFRYRFRGVRVPERVNRLPLPTGHFETPVSLVEVAQIGDDAELVIHLRYRSRPHARLEQSASGTVLSVDFPVGASDEPGLETSAERPIRPGADGS